MATRRIYLDYNASTPIDPAVAAAMRPFLDDHFGNPSSAHWAAIGAKAALEMARGQVAALLSCHNDEVVFTSGGSEANNLALKGVFFALREKGNHIITTGIEHPAIIEPCRFLERLGVRVTYLPVDGTGRSHRWASISFPSLATRFMPPTASAPYLRAVACVSNH